MYIYICTYTRTYMPFYISWSKLNCELVLSIFVLSIEIYGFLDLTKQHKRK